MNNAIQEEMIKVRENKDLFNRSLYILNKFNAHMHPRDKAIRHLQRKMKINKLQATALYTGYRCKYMKIKGEFKNV